MEKLKKARTRKTSNNKQSTYILLDVPTGAKLDQLSLAEFKKLIFYVGVSCRMKLRLNDYASKTRRDMAQYIPLDPKSKTKVVAIHLDDLHSNQALGLEYAIMFDMRCELTNVDDSGQANQVMYLRDPDIVTRISKLALNELFAKVSSNVLSF
uniref:DNA-directed RNA polymerase n=1 Tax=Rhabditophanes sp. KR3021 TaxID=114890 RepID=A0AC35UB90_9BILA